MAKRPVVEQKIVQPKKPAADAKRADQVEEGREAGKGRSAKERAATERDATTGAAERGQFGQAGAKDAGAGKGAGSGADGGGTGAGGAFAEPTTGSTARGVSAGRSDLKANHGRDAGKTSMESVDGLVADARGSGDAGRVRSALREEVASGSTPTDQRSGHAPGSGAVGSGMVASGASSVPRGGVESVPQENIDKSNNHEVVAKKEAPKDDGSKPHEAAQKIYDHTMKRSVEEADKAGREDYGFDSSATTTTSQTTDPVTGITTTTTPTGTKMQHPDGSTSFYRKDGTVIEKDGKGKTTTAHPDGTSTEVVDGPDGSRRVTERDATGQVTDTTTIKGEKAPSDGGDKSGGTGGAEDKSGIPNSEDRRSREQFMEDKAAFDARFGPRGVEGGGNITFADDAAVVAGSGATPDAKDRLLGGDNRGEVNGGGSGSGPAPGTRQSHQSTPAPDADSGPMSAGLEDDPMDSFGGPTLGVEDAPATGTDDAEGEEAAAASGVTRKAPATSTADDEDDADADA